MASMMDRGDSYRVGYVGAATLNQLATGLGILQKPLKELYFNHRKPGNPRSLPERYITMTSDGMIMTFYSEDNPSAPPVEEFYPISNILLWDAVQFVTVQGTGDKKDKKVIKSAFEPLDNDHSKVKDNLFAILDKKHHYLQVMTHPPMFTCVIRRKVGVKILDAHAFVCSSDQSALGLVSALNQVQSCFTAGQSKDTGVFGYSPFGKNSMSSSQSVSNASGRSMVPSVTNNTPARKSLPSSSTQVNRIKGRSQSVATDGTRPHSIQLQSELHSVTQSILTQQHNINTDHDSVQNINQTKNSLRSYRNSENNQNFGLKSGSRDSTSRVFHLSQEDLFAGGKPELSLAPSCDNDESIFYKGSNNDSYVGEREAVDEDEDGYQYLPHITHSLERPRVKDRSSYIVRENNIVPSNVISKAQFQHNDQNEDIRSSGNSTPNTHNSLEYSSRNSSRYGSIDSHKSSTPSTGYSDKNKPFNYLGGESSSGVSNSNPKNISASSPKKLNIVEEKHNKMGQGYSLLSGPNELPPSRRHNSDSPGLNRTEPVSRASVFNDSNETNRQIFRELMHLQKQQHPNDYNYGASDVYVEQHRQQRPGQLRPPKSPGYLDHPPNSRKRPEEQDSPEDNTVMPTSSSTSNIPFQSRISAEAGNSDPFPFRDRVNSNEAIKNKPIARVPPHMVTGVRVLPTTGASPSISEKNLAHPFHDESSFNVGYYAHKSPNMESTPRRAQSQYNISTSNNEHSNSSDKSKNKHRQSHAPTERNWQLGSNERSSKTGVSGKSQDLKNNMDDKLSEKLLLSKKKDAEIASVMQNLRLDFKDNNTLTPGAPGGMNFEKSLGYFP